MLELEVIALIISIASFIFSLAHAFFIAYWFKNIDKLDKKIKIDPSTCNHEWKIQMFSHSIKTLGCKKCTKCGKKKYA